MTSSARRLALVAALSLSSASTGHAQYQVLRLQGLGGLWGSLTPSGLIASTIGTQAAIEDPRNGTAVMLGSMGAGYDQSLRRWR